MKNAFITAFFAVLFALQPLHAKSVMPDLPQLTGRVVDMTGTLTGTQKSDLETMLEKYEKSTGNQMVVAFVNSTGGLPIEEYSIALAEKWKIGFKEKDNGIIILVAKDDRKMRIEVGYGLEGSVTDLNSSLVINNIMTPYFRNNDYYSGVKDAVISLAEMAGADSEFKDEYGSTNSQTTTDITQERPRSKTGSTIITIIIIIIFVLISFFSNKFRRGYSIGGRRNRNIFFGGGGFGSGGGGFSGGGFSGGGGGFGGGGASGSW